MRDGGRLAIYLSHRTALIDYATSIVGCRARAEDVVQEAYLRFARIQARVVDQPASYLYRIVRNLALDGARRLVTEARYQREDHIPWAAPQTAPTPEQEALRRDDIRRAANALAELPEQARIACEMHRFGEYTLEEIADRLNVSVTKVQRLVRQALTHVAAALKEPDDA